MNNSSNHKLSPSVTSITDQGFGLGLPYPSWLRVLLAILGVVYTTVGIPGNIIIIRSILKIKRLRIRINAFIVSLAIADLINIGYLYPFTVADLASGRYPGNEPLCVFNAFLAETTFPCGLANIFFIAVSRYTKVCRSSFHDKIFTLRKTVVICVCCWIFGPLFTLYNLSTNSLGYDRAAHNCMFNRSTSAFFTSTFTQVINVPPICISLFCYFQIWRKTNETRRKIWNLGNTLPRIKLAQENKSNKSNFVIFFLFTVLYLPFTTTSIFAYDNAVVQGIVLNLCFANCSLNSIVYGFMNKNIRKCYRQVLPAVWTTSNTNVRVQPKHLSL